MKTNGKHPKIEDGQRYTAFLNEPLKGVPDDVRYTFLAVNSNGRMIMIPEFAYKNVVLNQVELEDINLSTLECA